MSAVYAYYDHLYNCPGCRNYEACCAGIGVEPNIYAAAWALYAE